MGSDGQEGNGKERGREDMMWRKVRVLWGGRREEDIRIK